MFIVSYRASVCVLPPSLALPPMRSAFVVAAFVCCVLLCAAAVLPAAAHSDENGKALEHPLQKIRVEKIKRKLDGGLISIDTPLLNGTGSTVKVSFSGMSSKFPGNFDWIGVWSPKPADYTQTAPTKYKWVVPDQNGAGSTDMWFVNMRASYVVAYFTGGQRSPVMLAESAPVEFDNYHLPLQIHLALTNDPTEMRVDWNTLQNSFPSLQWGLSADSMPNTVLRVSTSTYTAADLCGAPATTTGFVAPGYLHSALIQGLTPNTQYFYQIGDESSNSKSEVLNFWSAPAASPDETQFVIFGDLGQIETDGSNEASQMDGSILTTLALAKDIEEGIVSRNKSAAVFHIGDISYARGFASIWEQFFYQISPMSPYLPWMTVDGNHERDFPGSGSVWTGQDSGGECGVALANRFHMPNPTTTARTVDTMWWSIDFGAVHFTVISTELAFNDSSAQLEWIKADWAGVDRSKTPFIVLAGHRPMYIDSTNDSPGGGDLSTGALLMAALEPWMQKYQVDVAFWGHHHSYQRTCAAHNFQCVSEEQGTVHIVTGAAGAGFSTNVQSPQPAWIEYITVANHGYVRARVTKKTAMTLEFVDAATRTVLDSVTIKSKFAADKLAKKKIIIKDQ